MKLKELRELKKLSQDELSKIIGVSQKTYSNYEKHTTEPNINTLIKLANFFDVTIDYLLGRPFANEFGYLSDSEKKLVSNFRKMTTENQKKFLAQSDGVLIAQK